MFSFFMLYTSILFLQLKIGKKRNQIKLVQTLIKMKMIWIPTKREKNNLAGTFYTFLTKLIHKFCSVNIQL